VSITPLQTPPAPSGPAGEKLLMALQLAADVLSTPFHFLVFAFTRRRHVAALQRALQESAR